MLRQNWIIISIIQGFLLYSGESLVENRTITEIYGNNQCVSVNSTAPPQILVHPKENIIASIGGEILLECEAFGVPQVVYSWKKNGLNFNLNSVNILLLAHDAGSFKIRLVTGYYEGIYQCFAQNAFGTAASRLSVVKGAYLLAYPPMIVVEHTVSVGDHLKIPCKKVASYPAPLYSWAITTTHDDETSITIQLDERVQQDVNGNIYFSNIELGDGQNNRKYMCVIFNPFLGLSSRGSYSRIKVLQGTPVEKRPSVEYSTPSPVIGIMGKNIEFKCLFSGYPTPNVSWHRLGGSLPINRTHILEFDTKLIITDLRREDEGDYVCSGYNKMGYENITLELFIEEIPVFTSPVRQPLYVSKSEGGNASFYCDASGMPPPTIQWYINGYYINSDNPGPRRTISSDDKMLTIYNVCKNCGDGQTDEMVIQCNASNVHGYTYGEGYLNVLSCIHIRIYSPSFGPTDGGTLVKMEGTFSALSTIKRIFLKPLQSVEQSNTFDCNVTEWNSKIISFRTPRVNESYANKAFNIAITFEPTAEDIITVDTQLMFTYQQNPTVTSFHPKESILSGGIILTVTGTNFDSVASPVMVLHVENRKYEASTDTYTVLGTQSLFSENTTVYNSTVILGVTPAVNLTNLQKRKRREVENTATTVNIPNLKVYVGVQFDGVETYTNLSTVLGPEEGEVALFQNPNVYQFKDGVLQYNPNTQPHIDIQGSGFISNTGYTVTIGNGICTVINVYDNVVQCLPPKEEPEPIPGITFITGKPYVKLRVGIKKEYALGHIDYITDNTIIIYTSVTVAVFVILCVFLIVCICLHYSKKDKADDEKMVHVPML